MENWKDRIKYYNDHEIEVGNIWSYGDNLHYITNDFLTLIKPYNFSAIATIEAKGLIYASVLADRLNLPLFIFRKLGKIRHTNEKIIHEFMSWRNETDGIEIETNEIITGTTFLVVDDLADKLNTFKAVHSILDKLDCGIAAFLCFANISGKKCLEKKEILSLIETTN